MTQRPVSAAIRRLRVRFGLWAGVKLRLYRVVGLAPVRVEGRGWSQVYAGHRNWKKRALRGLRWVFRWKLILRLGRRS